MKETYIAALEIGSSKITGAVGVYDAENKLKILAVEQEESRDCVRYGIIHNPDEVAARVTRIIDRLNGAPTVSPREITSIYVGLSGRSMRSVASEVSIDYPEDMEITGEILHNLRQDATDIEKDSNQEILAVVPRAYQIDGLETSTPKGAMGKSISAIYDLILGRTELKRNINRSITERTGLKIQGLIITELAVADIVLSNEEKRLGCMMVDFGAETTAVSIYRKGSLCYYVTIPLGGRNITRDLTTLSILEERAEEIKCESGRAIARETPSSLNIGGIKLSDVSNLIVARAEEIVANVVQQITYAGLTEKDLPGGIICIGAAAHLGGMLELLETQSGMNARMGHFPPFIQASEPRAKRHDTIQNAAILYAGALRGEDCLELPEPEVPEIPEEPADEPKQNPEPRSSGFGKFIRGISNRLSNVFNSGVDDDSELD